MAGQAWWTLWHGRKDQHLLPANIRVRGIDTNVHRVFVGAEMTPILRGKGGVRLATHNGLANVSGAAEVLQLNNAFSVMAACISTQLTSLEVHGPPPPPLELYLLSHHSWTPLH